MMARCFRFYTDTTSRTNEPPRRSRPPSNWKNVRRLCGVMANALAPATKATAMPRPTLDRETFPHGNMALIDKDTG